MDFPIQLSGQLREHLRSLRKTRGLTQAALGELLGLGQARIAEIEGNPGAVSVEQLMRVLSALRASLILRDNVVTIETEPQDVSRRPPGSAQYATKSSYAQRDDLGDTQPSSTGRVVRDAAPTAETSVTLREHRLVRPRKGSW